MWRLGMRRLGGAAFLALGLSVLSSGCFRMAVPDKPPTPVIVWPVPPEIPRVTYLNALSRPEDMGIQEGVLRSFLRYLAGRPETPLINPHGLAVDTEGRLYVVDNFLKKVHVFDQRAGKYSLFPEDDGPTLASPIGIAVDDRRGRVYVTDSADAVIRFFSKEDLRPLGEIRSGGIGRPTGIAVNPATDELLVVDTVNSGILRYALADQGLKGILGQEGKGSGRFHSPTHIAVRADGGLLVTDALNFRVQAFSPEGRFIRAFGAPGDSPGYFSRPKGVAVDSDGNIHVVDALFDNIQVFDADGRLLMAYGSPGHQPGEFWLPSGIHIDSQDRIYVSDSYNKRVQIFQYLKEGELP